MISVVRGALSDLDEPGFRQLVQVGEHLFIERKQSELGTCDSQQTPCEAGCERQRRPPPLWSHPS
jgi:hypothetical protein